jgi:hypothetical protein
MTAARGLWRAVGALAMVATVVTGESKDGWVRYRSEAAAGAEFSLEHPAEWKIGAAKGSSSIEIAAPDKSALLYVGAYSKPGSSLDAFAAIKFGVMANLFKPIGSARDMTGAGWKGLLQEGQDREGGRRIILCANRDDTYVSLTLYLDKAGVAKRDSYGRLFESLQFGK